MRVKEGLSSLQQADIISIYPAIRANLERIAHALYACELVDAITPEGHPLPRLYRLLAAYLDRLETVASSKSDRRFFELNLLNILGYRPTLERSARCDSPFGESGALLQDGGDLTCRLCIAGGRPITGATLKMLQACLGTGTFGLVIFPPEALTEAAALLDEAVATHTGRRLKSLEFLNQIGQD
jgi:DNA repair protein RecO (recombination protein O)